MIGTPFQMRVWKELSRIPFGETISYGEQAKRVGAGKAYRAVGTANGRNPIPIVVPCHRVLGANGVEKVLELEISEADRQSLHRSAAEVRTGIDGLRELGIL